MSNKEVIKLTNGWNTIVGYEVRRRRIGGSNIITVDVHGTTSSIDLDLGDWTLEENFDDHRGGLPIRDLTLRWVDVLHDSESDEPEGKTRVVTDFAHANVINSDVVNRIGSPIKGHQFADHKLVLDIDYPVKVVESSPGKSHLYIDKPITWDELISIMMTMVTAGIVERNYAMASIRRGYTSVRVPWALKGSGVTVPEPPTEDDDLLDL